MKTSPTLTSCNTLAPTLAIIGDKWTPLLIHALSQEPLRFCQLQDAVGGINPRTLSARLSNLEHEGIIIKVTRATMPPHTEYALTPKGTDLLPILRGMFDWGHKYH